ncbi:hypothetical protein HFC70_01040 [Agrobacterium sp. a22-2]|uniref:hypothetical protein n=1 Tax=Agrobacterium sp. a22-2 TaxID=2283840 RepID=UPI0014458137|nr:hypothetical protein [Agrobacterium sp. a22-2]NKN34933.1 hypothetical protein [Agrobacterium sp. a22-2]
MFLLASTLSLAAVRRTRIRLSRVVLLQEGQGRRAGRHVCSSVVRLAAPDLVLRNRTNRIRRTTFHRQQFTKRGKQAVNWDGNFLTIRQYLGKRPDIGAPGAVVRTPKKCLPCKY